MCVCAAAARVESVAERDNGGEDDKSNATPFDVGREEISRHGKVQSNTSTFQRALPCPAECLSSLRVHAHTRLRRHMRHKKRREPPA